MGMGGSTKMVNQIAILVKKTGTHWVFQVNSTKCNVSQLFFPVVFGDNRSKTLICLSLKARQGNRQSFPWINMWNSSGSTSRTPLIENPIGNGRKPWPSTCRFKNRDTLNFLIEIVRNVMCPGFSRRIICCVNFLG